ncbi:MAG: peptidylprolyl isomerase [Anaerolineales bacterium]|nr:peptidylprolyl isomerase [Anaerolineales bacterium]
MPSEQGKKPAIHTKKHVDRLHRERKQTRLILSVFIGILVLVIGSLVYGYLDVKYFQLQKPIAKVGDVQIPISDFQTRVRLARNGLLSNYYQYQQFGQLYGMDVTQQVKQIQDQLDNSEAIGQSVVDAMINEELIRQEATKRGITIPADQLEKSIQGNFDYFPNGTSTPTITPTEVTIPTLSADFLKYVSATPEITATLEVTATLSPASSGTPELAALPTATPTLTATATEAPTPTAGPTSTPEPTSTPFTLEGFKTEYQKGLDHFGKFGLTETQYNTLIKIGLLREQLFEAVTADTPHENEQVWARHILVATEEEAKAIIERLNKGEDFGALAAELSKDPGSGAKGGDLGWFGKGAMVPPFEAAAYALKVGEISAPVQSDFGWHIIQLIARQNRPLNAQEYQQARDKAFQDFLTKIREDYKVETYDTWKLYIPADPNFSTVATESVQQATDQAATDKAAAPSVTPVK